MLGEQIIASFEDADAPLNLEDDTDQVQELIRDFYVSITDISSNEFNVFYWECTETSKDTPKAFLDKQMLTDTSKLY